MEKVFEIYIRTTPERLWEAITDPEIRSKYNFGAEVTRTGAVGSRLEMGVHGASGLLGDGEILEVDPPRRLVHTLVALWSDEVKGEGASRVTWEIEPVGDSCRLVVTHDELAEDANPELYGGWPMILSGPEDLARDGRTADHAGIAPVHLSQGPALHRPEPGVTDTPVRAPGPPNSTMRRFGGPGTGDIVRIGGHLETAAGPTLTGSGAVRNGPSPTRRWVVRRVRPAPRATRTGWTGRP